MAYATLSHVVGHHPARRDYTASTIPSASQVAMVLDEIAAELDFALAKNGYESPLLSSAPSSVKAFFQSTQRPHRVGLLEERFDRRRSRREKR